MHNNNDNVLIVNYNIISLFRSQFWYLVYIIWCMRIGWIASCTQMFAVIPVYTVMIEFYRGIKFSLLANFEDLKELCNILFKNFWSDTVLHVAQDFKIKYNTKLYAILLSLA